MHFWYWQRICCAVELYLISGSLEFSCPSTDGRDRIQGPLSSTKFLNAGNYENRLGPSRLSGFWDRCRSLIYCELCMQVSGNVVQQISFLYNALVIQAHAGFFFSFLDWRFELHRTAEIDVWLRVPFSSLFTFLCAKSFSFDCESTIGSLQWVISSRHVIQIICFRSPSEQ